MDDVYVVIGLLLFGSLLFCLCCYKVSNLLYMLYHIDDVDLNDDNSPTAEGLPINGEFSKEAAYNFVTRYAEAANESASGNLPDVDKVGQLDDTTALLLADMSGSREPLMGNHVSHVPLHRHLGETSRTLLRPTGSVTSLSVGVQCRTDPQSPYHTANSETCLVLPPSSQHQRSHHRHHHQLQSHRRSDHVHLSDPDFRHSGFENPYHRATSSYRLHQHQHPYVRDDNRSPYNSNSLDRSERHHHESAIWQKRSQQPGQHSKHHHHNRYSPSPSASSRLSIHRGSTGAGALPLTMSSSSSAPRRYGSIRVAECSFIEHHEEPTNVRALSPPSIVETDEQHNNNRGSSYHYSPSPVPSVAFNPFSFGTISSKTLSPPTPPTNGVGNLSEDLFSSEGPSETTSSPRLPPPPPPSISPADAKAALNMPSYPFRKGGSDYNGQRSQQRPSSRHGFLE